MKSRHLLPVVVTVLGLIATDAVAVPYASGLYNTAGSTYSFVLNEPASSVSVVRDGGNELNLGNLAAGRHTFDLGSFTNFDISVSNSATPGYNAVDDTANLFTSFDRPGGMAINNIPSSPYFGTIYVNQNRGLNGGAAVVTGAGRTMGNGIYSLSADRIGINLTDFSVPADASDPTLAKAPGIITDATSSSSLYRIGMDDAGNIIASDWTNFLEHGGLAYISADLTNGARLLSPGLLDPNTESLAAGGTVAQDGAGFYALHGSINGEPQVSGTYGVDLVVSAMDEDLDADKVFDTANDGNAVWQWNVGSATSDFEGRPELIIAPGDLHTSSGQDKNTSGVNFPAFSQNPAGTHSDGSPVFLDYNIGVTANAQYNAHFDKWYLSGSRSNGDDSSNLVILTPEGPGGDGRDIEVDWASKQFTIDNDLDGYTDDLTPGAELSLDPHNDIFRQAHNVTFSPDNTIMFVHRRVVHDTNDVLGTGTDLGAKILAIPLDENGIPMIEFDGDGNISNITPIFAGVAGSSGSFSQVKTDIAGNVYYTGNQNESLEYFSLGGDTTAITSNNAALTAGAFALSEGGVDPPLPGDANGDGSVDLLDLDILGSNFGVTGTGTFATGDFNGDTNIDLLDLDILGSNFGNTSGALAVPEPTSLAIAAMLGIATAFRRRV